MSEAELADELQRATGAAPRRGVLGAQLTTFAIGGPLRLIEVDTRERLAAVLRFLHAHRQSYRILGNGSNLLIADRGVADWVIKLGAGFRFTRALGSGAFEVGARTALMPLSRELSAQGFSGLEFAGGIPALLGGAVRMNAGAHGGQMADVVREVVVLDAEGEEQVLSAAALEFSYRRAVLPQSAVVVGARLALSAGDPAQSAVLRARWLAERKARQPLTLPSAGSIFKNPAPELSAGRLLDEAGMKGAQIGGAVVSELHANWIVNPRREARCEDVLALIALCQERVLRQAGVKLEPELVVW